jgi:hypothetical protein
MWIAIKSELIQTKKKVWKIRKQAVHVVPAWLSTTFPR